MAVNKQWLDGRAVRLDWDPRKQWEPGSGTLELSAVLRPHPSRRALDPHGPRGDPPAKQARHELTDAERAELLLLTRQGRAADTLIELHVVDAISNESEK